MNANKPDLDAIARNLIALDLAYIDTQEATPYEHELSIITALNDALETAAHARDADVDIDFWQRLYPLLSDAAALLTSQTAPLFDLNAERHLDMTGEAFTPPIPPQSPCIAAPAMAATTGTWPSSGPSSASS